MKKSTAKDFDRYIKMRVAGVAKYNRLLAKRTLLNKEIRRWKDSLDALDRWLIS